MVIFYKVVYFIKELISFFYFSISYHFFYKFSKTLYYIIAADI